jgi:hypothetical protein
MQDAVISQAKKLMMTRSDRGHYRVPSVSEVVISKEKYCVLRRRGECNQ